MRSFALLSLLFLIFSCSEVKFSPTAISDPIDYEFAIAQIADKSIIEQRKQAACDQIDFWNAKLFGCENCFTYHEKLGDVFSSMFKLTGDLTNLYQARSHYMLAKDYSSGDHRAKNLIALAHNAMQLHQFKASLDFSRSAYFSSGESAGPLMMIYDAQSEMGMEDESSHLLLRHPNHDSFDFLIRYAGHQDGEGDLNGAIETMEAAFKMVQNRNELLTTWALSRLAEMYGHNGTIKQSYETFLKVLQREPGNIHALEGIAWIVNSHDRNPREALRILDLIYRGSGHFAATYAMAQIVPDESKFKKQLLDQFIAGADTPGYKDLYATQLIKAHVEVGNIKRAEELAFKEVQKRPTPKTYGLLAWAKYHNGQFEKALDLLEQHVIGKSFEPELIYISGMIATNAGRKQLGKSLLKDAHSASFELGPLIKIEIEKQLKV